MNNKIKEGSITEEECRKMFEYRVFLDKLKEEYAKSKNIKLLRISVDDDIKKLLLRENILK